VPALVDVSGLTVTFGGVRAVDGIDLRVGDGETLALVGRNGAGKSTTLRVLAGVLPPTGGRILIGGHDARADPLAAKTAVGYCPDVGGLIPRATPWEHLVLSARLRQLSGPWQQRAEELLEQFGLADVADRLVSSFSHGMTRRLSVLLAAFHNPTVLLLDEPFDGVDPFGVNATLQVVEAARARGAAVILSTHLIQLAAKAAQQAVILARGRVVRTGPARELSGERGSARYEALLS
jgi:ABC-2 type transport system ATP-binding protein